MYDEEIYTMSRPRALSGLAAALGFSVLAAATAAAQPTALIIGNSNYSNFSNLPDAAADATMLAETLGGNGYDVSLLTNAGAQETRAALSAFFAGEAAPEHRLFIYSGHVVSVDGVTHLVPADAAVTTGLDLAFNFIAMDDVRAQMERDEIPEVVIMDTNYRHLADNQLKPLLPGAQISDRAAAPADSESTLTLMAVQPGARNLGQKNDANVFATILNNRLSRMDREAVTFLTNVGARVENQSSGRQTPYLSGGFTADVRLNPEVEEPVAEGPTAREQRLWDAIQGSDNVEDFEDYLAFFPEGYYAEAAQAAIDDLNAPDDPQFQLTPINESWYVTRKANVRSGPSTSFDRIARLPAATVVYNLGQVADSGWYQIIMPDNSAGFIHPALLAPWAASELAAWSTAQSEGTIEAYQAYLDAFPEGPNAESAQVSIDVLLEQAYREQLASYRIQSINRDVVITRRANLRRLPTTRSQVASQVDGGTRLTATGIVRGHPWIRLDLNGETVFVHNSLYVVYEGSVFAAWDQAVEADTLLGYVRFRAQHPNSPFEQEAVAAIQSLQAAESTGFKALNGIHVVKRASSVYRKTSRQSAVLTEASAGDTFRATRQSSNGRWIELRLGNGTLGYIRAGRVELYAGSVFEAWDQARDANTVAAYRDFRDEFPGSRFDEDAVSAIEELLAQGPQMRDIREKIYLTNRAFVLTQPDVSAPRLGVINADVLITATGQGGDPEFFRINTTSGVGYVLASSAALYAGSEREAWDQARTANSVEAVNAYLAAYPNGRWLQPALQLRQQLTGYEINLGGLNIRLFPGS